MQAYQEARTKFLPKKFKAIYMFFQKHKQSTSLRKFSPSCRSPMQKGRISSTHHNPEKWFSNLNKRRGNKKKIIINKLKSKLMIKENTRLIDD